MTTPETTLEDENGELLELGLPQELLDTIERQYNVWPTRIMAKSAFFDRVYGNLTANPEIASEREGFDIKLCHIHQALDRYHQMLKARQKAHEDCMEKIMLGDLELLFEGPLITVLTECPALWDLAELYERDREELKRLRQKELDRKRKEEQRWGKKEPLRRSKRLLEKQKKAKNRMRKGNAGPKS